MSEELVDGRTYKVRLRPIKELLDEGSMRLSDLNLPHYVGRFEGQVGVFKFSSGNSVPYVYWSDGESGSYTIGKLKILGEV